MQYKGLSFLLLATVAVAQQSLDDYLDDAGYDDKLSSLEALATKTNVDDYLTGLPTDYTVPSIDIPTPPPSIVSVLATAVPPSFYTSVMDEQGRADLYSSIKNGDYPQWYQDLPGDVKTYLSTAYATDAVATGDATATGGSSAPTGSSSNSGDSGDSGDSDDSEDSGDSGSAASSTSEGIAAPTGAVAASLMGAAGILGLAIVL